MQRNLIVLIVLGVLAWGAFHAVGSYYGGDRLTPSAARGLVVLGFTLAFLTFWLLMLRGRAKRLGGERADDEDRKS